MNVLVRGGDGLAPELSSAIVRQGVSIGVSLIPFGLAFGVACSQAGLSWLQALGLSSLVFTGGSQFAAVGVLGDGGSAFAAITAGLLLAVRSLVYGLVMTPVLKGSLPFRLAASHLMIDEAVAVSAGQPDDDLVARRFGYFAGGLSVFVVWTLTTVIGVIAFSGTGGFVEEWGIDGTIPAAFAALLWPKLRDRVLLRVAVLGALIAFVMTPLLSPGLPIVAAAGAVLAGMRVRPVGQIRREAQS